jgi:hypothetical protein
MTLAAASGRIYHLLDELQYTDLEKPLLFPNPQDRKYRFGWMSGTQERYLPWLSTGEMREKGYES